MSDTKPPKKLISAREVAAFYGISLSTLWRWINQGLLPAPIRIGRRTFWETQTLDQHIAALRPSN
jgi:predicted DNA-binding transcriptional regulator AlpA